MKKNIFQAKIDFVFPKLFGIFAMKNKKLELCLIFNNINNGQTGKKLQGR